MTIASNSRCNSLLPFANASIGTRLSLNTCEPRIFSNSNQNLYKKQSLIIRRISLACITQTCRSWLWRPPTSYTLYSTPPRKTTSNGWLVACHRHYKFAQDFPPWIHRILELLQTLCWVSVCLQGEAKEVIVPNKMADFMWHSHMLDHEAYRLDTHKMFGKMLNHVDEYNEKELAHYW